MTKAEVKLNDVYYKLTRLPQQVLANQMASKVGQGTSEYGDLTTWSAWIQEDWQEGVGKLKPQRGGGFLYGEVESRIPGQLILPQRMNAVNRGSDGTGFGGYGIFNPQTTAYDITVGTGGYAKAAVRTVLYDAIFPKSTVYFYFYAFIPAGVSITIDVMNTNGGATYVPTTVISTTTYTPPEENSGWYWHGKALDTSAIASGNTYAIAVYPTSGSNYFTWAVGNQSTTLAGTTYNGSAWTNMPIISTYMDSPYFLTSFYANSSSTTMAGTGSGFFRFNNKLYSYSNNKLFEYSSSFPYWDSPATTITGVTAVTGATVFVDKTYFGNLGGDGDYTTMNTSEAFTDTGADGKIFTKFKGNLWRANANYVEYSEDGTVWEPTATFGDPIYVTDSSDSVTGMCGMGDIMYVSTQNGLVPIYPGDVVTGGRTWGSFHAQNGTRMVEFEGALYITVNGRVVRYTEDGSMQDVWMTRDDDVLVGRIGKVWDIEKVNNWLFALVEATVANGKPTIWAYQNNSWHHMATLPPTLSTQTGIVSDYDLFYDRATSKLWAITPAQLPYWWYVPDYSINPYNDPASRYMRTAWVEWDWFDGPILEVYKDMDSITIMGENMTAARYVKVYWKDDDSTAWELLGTADSNIEELRWGPPPYTTRPNTRRLKLGLLLVTDDATETPRVRAIRLKYHLMVRDWFRWNLQIDVAGRSGATQMLVDGTKQTLTNTQIKANIDALIKTTPPFLYMDVDGQYYEVKCTDANFQYTKYEFNESTSNEWWEGVYNLVLEQITQGVYTPP